MALTAEELGISSDDWNTLATSLQHASFSLDLYKWQPEFGAGVGTPSFYPDFGAAAYGSSFVRVTPYTAKMNSTPISGYTGASGHKNGSAFSVIVDGTSIYAYAITATGISLNSYISGIWSGYSEIVTDSRVIYLAATSPTTVHYLTLDSSHHYTQFHVAILSGSWSITDSDLYWGYSVNSFDAKRLNGVDVLCLASDMPGIQSVTVVGTSVSKKILPSGGVFIFTYQYGTWSDHYEIDHIDQWSSFRYRNQVRLSAIGSRLWLTCFSSEGTLDAPVLHYRVYYSTDGLHWSRGELLPLPTESVEGIVLIGNEDRLYAIAYDLYFESKSTLWFETSHADMHLSLAGKVLDLQINRSDLQQIAFTIDNRQNWFTATDFASGKTIAAILKTGFGALQVQQGIFEIDTTEVSRDIPKRTVQLQGRDHFAWMMSKSQSEQFENWSPQVIGVDEYVDNTGTGYGGMGYTAEVEGSSFKAADGALQLINSNDEGIAYATWLTDNWNGAVEEWFELSTLGNHEYAGLVFRSPDKDNGFYYYYDQNADKLKLDSRLAGSGTNLWQSSAKSWSGSLVGRFLRAEFRYSRIFLYSSNASSGGGITWTLEHSHLVDGQIASSSPLVQSGYVGVIGKGFSDLSLSSPAFGAFPAGSLPSDYLPYTPETHGIPVNPDSTTPPTTVFHGTDKSVAAFTSDGHLLVTGDITQVTATFTDHDLTATFPSGIADATVDPFSSLYLGTGGSVDAYILYAPTNTAIRLYKMADVFGARVLGLIYTSTDSSCSNARLRVSRWNQNQVAISYIKNVFLHATPNQSKVISTLDCVSFNEVRVEPTDMTLTGDQWCDYCWLMKDGTIIAVAQQQETHGIATSAFSYYYTSLDGLTFTKGQASHSGSANDVGWQYLYTDESLFVENADGVNSGVFINGVDSTPLDPTSSERVGFKDPLGIAFYMGSNSKALLVGATATYNVEVMRDLSSGGTSWTLSRHDIVGTETLEQCMFSEDDPQVAISWGNKQIAYTTGLSTTAPANRLLSSKRIVGLCIKA